MNVEHILASKGREVRTIGPEATVPDALHRMHDQRVGALVVWSVETVIGWRRPV